MLLSFENQCLVPNKNKAQKYLLTKDLFDCEKVFKSGKILSSSVLRLYILYLGDCGLEAGEVIS